MSNMKRIAALIVARSKPDSKYYDSPLEDDGDDELLEGKEAAAEELLGAIHDNDPKAVVEAFKSLYEMCSELSDRED